MSAAWSNLPAWVSATGARALADDGDVTLGCIVAGKLMRARASRLLHPPARAFVLNRLSSQPAYRALEAGSILRGDEAVAAAQRLASELEEHGSASADSLFACALQRDDVAALAHAMGSAILSGKVDAAWVESWQRVDEAIASYGAAVDATIAPYWPDLQRSWRQASAAGAGAPDELLSALGSGANPWWLDLFDPVWDSLEPAPEQPLDLAAATADETVGPAEVWQFERGIRVELAMRHDGTYRCLVRGASIPVTSELSLSWLQSGKRQSVALQSLGDGLRDGIVDRSVQRSPIVYLLLDGHIVVREP